MKLLKKYNIKLSYFLFLIPAIIHFVIVCFAQYNMGELNVSYLSKSQFIIFIITKIVTFFIIAMFYRLIVITIYGFKKNNQKVKEITTYFSIYFIPNLILLFMIYPGVHTNDSLIINNLILTYEISECSSYLTNIFQLLSYNVSPTLFGISLCHIFVFSLILAYIIYTLKNELYNGEEKKYVYIMYGIFFIPSIMILNSNPYKQTYSFWILILIFTLILTSYKTKKNMTNNIIAINLAVLSFVLVSIRFECLILLIILPVMIYFLKIFDKKRFFVFSSAFLLLYFGLYCIEMKHDGLLHELHEKYVLHNLLFIYDKLIKNDYLINQLTYDDKLVIKKVYPEFETKNVSTFIDISDKDNVKRVKNILEKHLILNSFNFFQHNMYVYQCYIPSTESNYKILIFFDSNKFYSQKYKKKFKFINLDLRNKILSNTMISTKYSTAQIYLKTIGNPICYYLILFLILAAGIKYKKLFYIWFSSIFILIFPLLMVLVPWLGMLYVIPYYMCSYWIFMIFVLDIIQYFKKHKNNKII